MNKYRDAISVVENNTNLDVNVINALFEAISKAEKYDEIVKMFSYIDGTSPIEIIKSIQKESLKEAEQIRSERDTLIDGFNVIVKTIHCEETTKEDDEIIAECDRIVTKHNEIVESKK